MESQLALQDKKLDELAAIEYGDFVCDILDIIQDSPPFEKGPSPFRFEQSTFGFTDTELHDTNEKLRAAGLAGFTFLLYGNRIEVTYTETDRDRVRRSFARVEAAREVDEICESMHSRI